MAGSTEREFGAIRVTTVDWPIVLVEFPERRVDDGDLLGALDHVESLFTQAAKAREKIFILADLTSMREVTPAGQRKLAADWMKRTAPMTKVTSAGAAMVTPSAILRGIITAVYWLQPPPTPSFCVATRHEGMLKGIERLEAVKALLSPRLLAYRDKYGLARVGGARR
jgi:hypothetical protein